MGDVRNYYDVLNCLPTSSLEELRRNFKSLVLRHHPDKCHSAQSEAFMLIDKAWKTLSDPELRKCYDEHLHRQSIYSSYVIYATLSMDDIMYNKELKCYTCNCRCGGLYSVDECELQFGDIIVPCEDCSMAVVIKEMLTSSNQDTAPS